MESELSVLHAARMMNPDALITIFDSYASAVYRYALRLCGDPVLADHIVGDVFANLLDQFSLGSGPRANLRSYLFQITFHLVINEVRYMRGKAPLEAAASLGRSRDTQAVSRSMEAQLLYKHVLHAIYNELTTDQRHVITLRFLEGLSIRETAAVVGKTIANVKVIQARAIRMLQKSFVDGQPNAG